MVEVILVRKGVRCIVSVRRIRVITRCDDFSARGRDVARYLVIIGIRGVEHHTSRVVVLRCDSACDLLHTLSVTVVDVGVGGAVACRIGVRIGRTRYFCVSVDYVVWNMKVLFMPLCSHYCLAFSK